MASTYSTSLKIELIGTGEQSGTWGGTTNTNLGTALEQAIVGKADIDMDSTTVTLTLTNTNAAQDARAFYLNLTGTPGGAATLEVPAVEKPYIVRNGSNQVVTVKVSGQTGVAVPVNATMWLYNNGTDVTNAITNLPSGATVGGTAISTSTGTVTSVAVSGGTTGLTTSGGPITSSGTITLSGTLAVANGGTSGTSFTANNVLLGNGTSAFQVVSPGTTGNVLTSNGTTWTSAAAASLNTPLAVVGNNTAGAEIRLPEDTDNGSNYVALKAADNIASNVTFTLPNADGTNGQAIVTNGSGVLSFATAGSPEVKTPTNVSPTNAATDIGETPALTGSTYYSLYGIAMAAGQWQVSTVPDFASTVVNTGDVAGTSVTYTVTAGVLSTSTTYYWRVRYKDSDGSYSDWSTATTFTTAAAFAPTVIGQSFGGGFYAGKINQSGTEYYLIVAPKSSGENSSKQWKTTNTTTSGTTSVIDGPTNSANMNNATHPAAEFCEGLSIGGFSDWYMPAKNELEVCYYNLKPTTTANNTNSGTNTNAVPSRGSNYTSGDPAQTSANDFKTGNSEAFAAGDYWSSTEGSATDAWRQGFNVGDQASSDKLNSYYVRAVRRVAV